MEDNVKVENVTVVSEPKKLKKLKDCKTLEELNEVKYKYDSKYMKLAKKFAMDEFTNLFVKYPELHSFVFAGYAPYFNDGDPCTFSIHGADIYFKKSENKQNDKDPGNSNKYYLDEDEDYLENEYQYGEIGPSWDKPEEDKEKIISDEICSLVENLDEDLFHSLFNTEDALIEFTPNGFNVNDISHN